MRAPLNPSVPCCGEGFQGVDLMIIIVMILPKMRHNEVTLKSLGALCCGVVIMFEGFQGLT